MKVGFFHDHNFIEKNNIVYTTGTLDSQVWSRYLVHEIDKLIICARKNEKHGLDINNLAISSNEGVYFIFSPNLSNISSLVFGLNHSVLDRVVQSVDVVISRLPSEIGFSAIRLAKKYNKKVICEVVACPYDALRYHGSLLAKTYATLIKYRMKKWVSVCDGAIYVTEKELQNRYPNSHIVQNASNVEIHEICNNCTPLRIDRFIERKNNNHIKFGIIGTLKNNTKGIDVAIKALSGKSGHLHVLGSGDSSRFEKLADEYGVDVHFDGFKSNKIEVMNWLDDIDIYIQPSFQEGLPRATIEAMSRGCMILSSDAGGLSELTFPGFIHHAGDSIKLSNDIDNLINNVNVKVMIEHSLCVAKLYLSDFLYKKRYDFYGNFLQK